MSADFLSLLRSVNVRKCVLFKVELCKSIVVSCEGITNCKADLCQYALMMVKVAEKLLGNYTRK
jgi:hypothetical protein